MRRLQDCERGGGPCRYSKKEGGSLDVNQLIEENMGLVYKQLHYFHLIDDEDAFSIAIEALWTGISTYSPDKGSKLSTYATVCIYNALGMYVRRLKRKQRLDVVSYETPIEGSDGLTIKDVLTDSVSAYDAYEKKELAEILDKACKEVMAEARNEKARKTIEYWYKSNGTMRTVEIARLVGYAQPTVSNVLITAKYQIRKKLEEYL